nr:zinc-binding dehydrogenase [Accumulibacter sp.]
MGAHHVSSHRERVRSALDYAVSLTHTEQHFAQPGESIAPQGLFGSIGDPASIDRSLLKRKSLSLHWGLMFTCSPFETDDMVRRGRLLCEIAEMVDQGQPRSTLVEYYVIINAANLKRAHAIPESGRARGKPVPDGSR